MVLARESFLYLTIAELLQSINCYHDSLRDYKKLVRPVQDFYIVICSGAKKFV